MTEIIREETIPNSLYEVSITQYQKKTRTQKQQQENYSPLSVMNTVAKY
jgi:hypothetical protein